MLETPNWPELSQQLHAASGARFRIVGLAMAKNEQDIIEPFVRHNLRYLDRLIVLENNSADRTPDILAALARETSGLAWRSEPSFQYIHGDMMSLMVRTLQPALRADFFVLLDADEFILARDRASFESALANIPAGACGLMPWLTYVLTPDTVASAHADPPRSIGWRRAKEFELFAKAIIRLDGAVDPGLTIKHGNHTVYAGNGARMPSGLIGELPLAHFPVRSHAQFMVKVINGWMANLARNRDAGRRGVNFHWRDEFETIKAGKPISAETLAAKSLLYAAKPRAVDWTKDAVYDPLPFDYARKYSDGGYGDPIALLASAWEQSLLGAARNS